jgi:hypothetical protein
MSFAEPLHLPPAPKPAPFECECCSRGYNCETDLQRFGGKFACGGCISSGHCKECRETWASEGSDLCLPCTVRFYRENPAEFDDAFDILKRGMNGREIIRLVTGNPTAMELAREATASAKDGDFEAASVLLQEALLRRGRQ